MVKDKSTKPTSRRKIQVQLYIKKNCVSGGLNQNRFAYDCGYTSIVSPAAANKVVSRVATTYFPTSFLA
jgi:hypothetical protein